MYPSKFKSIFLLAIFQKDDQFEITCIHVRGTIHFSVCDKSISLRAISRILTTIDSEVGKTASISCAIFYIDVFCCIFFLSLVGWRRAYFIYRLVFSEWVRHRVLVQNNL